MECISCSANEASDPLGYCASCAIETKLELAAGFRRLNAYLAAWAAFQDWLQRKATASPP